jgi:transposase InsO family protein
MGKALRELGVVPSMGSRGCAYDNAACESAIGTRPLSTAPEDRQLVAQDDDLKRPLTRRRGRAPERPRTEVGKANTSARRAV